MEKFKQIKEKIIFWVKDNYWLLLILSAGFLVRCYGIYFDYPVGINYIWDETLNIINLIDIIETKSFFSSIASPYPTLLTFLYAPVLFLRIIFIMLAHKLSSVVEFKDFVLQNGMGYLYIIVRWYAVAFGTAGIYVVYKIFNYISKNKIPAYLASLVFGFGIISVFLSHWGKAHIVMIFFFLLSLYFSLRFEREKKNKYFYLSSLFAGCSASVHYTGFLAVIFPFLNLVYNFKNLNYKVIGKSILIGIATILLFYGLNYNGVKYMVHYQDENYYSTTGYTGMSNVSLLTRFTYVITDSWKIEPFLTTLFFLLLLFAFRKIWQDKLNRYLIFGILFFYIFMITVTVLPGNNRWLLIFMVLAYPLAIVTLYDIVVNKFSQKIAIGLCLLMILPSFIYCLKWDTVISRYTAIEAADWLENNVNKGDWIYSFYYNLYLPFSYQGALWNKDNNQLEYKKIDYILNHKDNFENQGYNLAYDYNKLRYQELAGKKTKYIVIASGDKKDLENQYDNLRKYNQFTLVKSFSPFAGGKETITGDVTNNPDSWKKIFNFSSGGQFINIYKVK